MVSMKCESSRMQILLFFIILFRISEKQNLNLWDIPLLHKAKIH